MLEGKEKEKKVCGASCRRAVLGEGARSSESNCTPRCAQPVSGLTGSYAQGCPKPEWAGAWQGRAGQGRGRGTARDGSDVAIVVGTVSCVRAGGDEFSRKGSWLPAALHHAWVPRLLQLAPVTDYLT